MPVVVGGARENRRVTVAVGQPVEAMSDCLNSLRDTLSGLDDKRITQALRDMEALSRRVHAVMLDLVVEIDSRGIAGRAGFGSTQRLVAGMLHLSAGDARARVEQASRVGARQALTGQTLAPRLPATAAALAAGEIGLGQLQVITETIGALPASVPQPARDRADAALAGYARDFDPRRLRIIATRLLSCLDPDGPPPPDDELTASTAPRGELWLRQRRDGRLGVEGWLDPEHGSLVRALIEQLATRRPDHDGEPDTRTVPIGIRCALVARDGGCAFPGCDRPPGLSEAHHARHWIDGGETSVQNCCLLCPAHHHQVHHQAWDVTVRGGRVEFRPPTIIDPDQH